jgi:hypothetical protein
MVPGTLQATQILIALMAKEPDDMQDVDRTCALAAYMSKTLDGFMQDFTVQELERVLWPEVANEQPQAATVDATVVDASGFVAP